MTYILPKIDQRSQQDLASEIRRLILDYCPEFISTDEIESDKQADALINIFSTMMGHVIDAVNQAPEKNYTAFLNLIGVSPTAPRVAKAPMVFKLKRDWDKDGYIPAGTKISAQPENQEEVVFETESDLTLIRPTLVKAVSIEPAEDQWSNLDFLLSSETTGKEAELFRGDTQILHRIYIGHSKFLSLNVANIKLTMTLNQLGMQNLQIQWYYFDEDGNSKPLIEKPVFLQNGIITFPTVRGISPKTISGYSKNGSLNSWNNHWIYAELKTPITKVKPMPEIENLKIGLDISAEALSPEIAIFNYSPLDLTKDFYPFGERPAFNDTFYIACSEAFSKKGATITIGIVLSDGKVTPNTTNIVLGWESWNGNKWVEFGRLSKPIVTKDTTKESTIENAISADSTLAFTNTGDITFTCPEIKSNIVNGQENYWIRVRIIGGNYGEDSTVTKEAQFVPSTYQPPLIKEVTIKYTYTALEEVPEMVITENNFILADKTNECLTAGKTFKLFSACTDSNPTFYLAFDQDISNLPLSLFFPLTGDQIGENPVVAWEYWNGLKWLTLSVNDAIRDFTRREIQQINIPADIESCSLFGTESYWIRARLEDGSYSVFPKINTVYSNAVWAGNSITINGEMLGSSSGEPNQTFQISRTPVLPGQIVKVHETLLQEDWITWEEVQTFSLSGTDSRHYMLDSKSGTLTFGDGKNGMIPPAGADNIQCDYQYGGGTLGNVKAGTISKLWDNYPEIDSVTNPVAADGGFDQEELHEAKVRGPHTLESRNRGVTCEDVEWLVREAAPQIAIVKCFPTMDRDLDFTPGKATVIVVPEYDDPKPVPSQELLNEIDEYLSDRISTVLNAADVPRLDVIGPDYIRVGVEAAVNYTTPESAKIIEGSIIDNLKQFLNPLNGGQERAGWKLGKNLYISEVCSEIRNTSGVDYITDIAIKASVQCYTLNLESMKNGLFKPNVTYPTYSAVKSSDNRIVFALAQKLQMNKGVKSIQVKGFRENDKLVLRYRNCPTEELVVVSVEGDILECQTFDGEPLAVDYPVGSDVEAAVTQDLTIRSYILNQITGKPTTFFIKIAVPEPRDIIYLSRNDEYTNTTPLKIREVRTGDIFLEEDELVYSGVHLINKRPNLKFPYLLNMDTNIIHDLNTTTSHCRIGEILKEDRRYLEKITEVAEAEKCKYCFPSEE